MALIQRTMTEKDLAAHQRNARLSHGAATPEGKERARGANLRHGYYSQMRDQALAALGEDPEGLAELVEGAREQFRPTNAYQAWITDRLASLQWRIQRAERMQENQAATRVREVQAKRRQAAGQLAARWADVQDFLQSLRRAVARPDFYSPTGCFERAGEVLEQSPSANMEKILELLHPLRRPRGFSNPAPPPLPEAMTDQEWENIVAQEGDEPSGPDPEIPVAEGKERDSLRQQLWNLAGEELRRATQAWQQTIAAQEAPLSTCARDLTVLEISKEMELMRREERSCVREFSRLGNELRKLQKALEAPEQKAGEKSRDQSSQVQASQVEASGAEGADEEKDMKNEGASGQVEENTGDQNYAGATKCPSDPAQPQIEAVESDDISAEPGATPSAVAASLPPVGARVDKKLVSRQEAA